jgi:cysteine desulfurase/selenocysteine lyase
MIETVTREGAKYAELPHKFEAGTVNAAGAAGLDAAIDYINYIGYDNMEALENELTSRAFYGLKEIPHVNIIGSDNPLEHTGIISFTIDDVHPHDISEVLAADKIAVRSGHHCAQPLLTHLGVSSSARASFMFYNTNEEVDRFLESVKTLRSRMGFSN